MRYTVVRAQYDNEYPELVEVTFQRDRIAEDEEGKTYNLEHTNYVPVEDAYKYWVGRKFFLIATPTDRES